MSPPDSAHPRIMFLNKSGLDEIPDKEFKSTMINPFIETKDSINTLLNEIPKNTNS